ncbi:MAG: DUF2330 domain-containing protein, partial [Deltaproteobacteria bacterium]|nr:DUF2330 domain-containing protein [Deltaproteobacteria bacterium]
ATVVDFVVHNDDGSWDNNGGSDWHIPIAPCGTPDPSEPVPDPAPVPDPGPDPDPEPVPEPVPDAPAEPVPDSPTEPDAASPDAAASDATPATDAPGKDAATGGSGGGSGCSSGPSAGVPAAIVLALLPALALLSRRRRAVALAAAALAAAPAAASADGLVFQATGATQAVGVQAQRAVIWQRADALDLMIEPRFDWEGDGTWVVPLPALPEIAPGDAVFLSELDRLTAPITLTYCRESICHGCQAVPAEGGGRATGASAPVQVWTSGNIGALDYVVLSATEGQDAADWLAGHGFDLPDTAAEAVASLAVEGTYFFAARLGRQAEAGASLPPVRFRFAPTVAPFYPLRLTGAGIGDGMLEVLLWHVSRADGETALSIDGAPRSTGQSAPADGWILEHGGRPADNRLVQGKSSDLGCYTTYPYGGVDVTGSQLGFPTEWTSALTREVIDSGWFVTRLRGRLAAPMLEADVAPGPLPIEEVTFAGVHCVDEGRCPGSGCPPCADEGPEASSPDPAGDGRADASAGDATAGGSGGGGGCASGTPPAPGALALLLLASALLAHAVRRRSG